MLTLREKCSNAEFSGPYFPVFGLKDLIFFPLMLIISIPMLTHLFPMHAFSTPENIRKPQGFLMFSGGRESVHWEQMS